VHPSAVRRTVLGSDMRWIAPRIAETVAGREPA
jgi:hypothetical protein